MSKNEGYIYLGALKDPDKEEGAGGSLWLHESCGHAVPFGGFEAHAAFHDALADLFDMLESLTSGKV
jgi:hypothetical protein